MNEQTSPAPTTPDSITLDEINQARLRGTAEGVFVKHGEPGDYPDYDGSAIAERAEAVLNPAGANTAAPAHEAADFTELNGAYAGYLRTMGIPAPAPNSATSRPKK